MMERQVKTNIEQLEANIAKLQREIKIQSIKYTIVVLVLLAAAFALGYYTR